MVLNYKIDSKERLWLLFCSTLVFKGKKISEKMNSEAVFDLPDYVDKSKLKFTFSRDLYRRIKCFSCDDVKDKDSLYIIKYSALISSWELDHNCEQFNSSSKHSSKEFKGLISLRSFISKYRTESEEIPQLSEEKRLPDINNPLLSVIPPVIRRVEPKLTVKEYLLLKIDPGFLHKSALVCEKCFLYYMQSSIYNTNLETIQIRQAFKIKEQVGVGKQKPENLMRTRDV